MKVGFDLHARIRAKGSTGPATGQLRAGDPAAAISQDPLGRRFPHYVGDGFYFVELFGYETEDGEWIPTRHLICHEDDIEVVPSVEVDAAEQAGPAHQHTDQPDQ